MINCPFNSRCKLRARSGTGSGNTRDLHTGNTNNASRLSHGRLVPGTAITIFMSASLLCTLLISSSNEPRLMAIKEASSERKDKKRGPASCRKVHYSSRAPPVGSADR